MNMNFSTTDNEKMTGSSHSNKSILGAMQGFIDAVNEMDETVLIPSLLMDMKVDQDTVALRPKASSLGDVTVFSVDTVVPTNHGTNHHTQQQESVSLHACYSMLKAVKSELIRGPMSTEDRLTVESNGKSLVESTAPVNQTLEEATSLAFREHLIGLFGVLQQLTHASKKLTGKYQEELGDYQSCIKPRSTFLM